MINYFSPYQTKYALARKWKYFNVHFTLVCICATNLTKLNKFSELLEVVLPVSLEQILLDKSLGSNGLQITRS